MIQSLLQGSKQGLTVSGRTLSGHLQEHGEKHQSGIIEPGSPRSVKFLQTIWTETIILNVKSNWPELGPTVDAQHEIFKPPTSVFFMFLLTFGVEKLKKKVSEALSVGIVSGDGRGSGVFTHSLPSCV